jgi:hypothetical protein
MGGSGAMSYWQTIEEMKAACCYSEDGGVDAEGNDLSSVDALIDYKNALEEAYGELLARHYPLLDMAKAWGEVAKALALNAHCRLSAAAVCQVGFEQQERLRQSGQGATDGQVRTEPRE